MSTRPSSKQKNTSLSNIIVWAVAAIAVLVGGLMLINRTPVPLQPQTTDARQVEPASDASVSGIAPPFSLPSVSGRTMTLEDFHGKVVMLNFWATWCGPCKKEIPDFMELQKKYKDRGFSIVGIALDEQPAVEEYVREHSLNYPVLMGDMNVAQAYGGVQSIPSTFLIDRSGKIVSSQVGLQSPEFWEKAITELL